MSPLWLAPDRVRVIALNDDEALINYAKPIVAELRANMVRVDSDFSATPFNAKEFVEPPAGLWIMAAGRENEASTLISL